jgi:predicted enzyme related to lactoylglutathione lyase
MRLFRIIIPVGDINEAEQFYSALLGTKGERVSPGRHYFNLGGTIVACYDAKADGDDPQPRWMPHENQYLYFAVDDLEETFERVKKLNTQRIDRRIEKMPWGERLFYLRDPWGNPLCCVDESTVFLGSKTKP